MLFFVGTRFHSYTLHAIRATECGGHGVMPIPMSYDDLFATDRLQGGTYLFTDIERLSAHERQLAAELYRAMAQHPGAFRILNDPARVRGRYALLRALYMAGLNDFDAYRATGQPRPRRFPVFVKSESDHGPAITDLLADQTALDQALEQLEDSGQPLDSLLVIEFAGEPVRPGVWIRHTAFRVGGTPLLDLPVTERHWMVKEGEIGLADEDMYVDDEVMVAQNRYASILSRAFELGRIDYGRLDFGLVKGRPQVYEINTNPNIPGLDPPHPSAARTRTREFTWARLMGVMADLSSPSKGMIELDLPLARDYCLRSGVAALGWRP